MVGHDMRRSVTQWTSLREVGIPERRVHQGAADIDARGSDAVEAPGFAGARGCSTVFLSSRSMMHLRQSRMMNQAVRAGKAGSRA
jgi:hypothetical protein